LHVAVAQLIGTLAGAVLGVLLVMMTCGFILRRAGVRDRELLHKDVGAVSSHRLIATPPDANAGREQVPASIGVVEPAEAPVEQPQLQVAGLHAAVILKQLVDQNVRLLDQVEELSAAGA
jgi:hypothetical protein